jgi:plastocyanin
MPKHKIVLGFAAVFVLASITAYAQDAGPAVVAIPGTFLTNYATPVAVVAQGGKLNFVNLDIAMHDVIAVDDGTRTDCPARLYRGTGLPGDPIICPLFWTTQLESLGTISPVIGVEDLDAAKTYDFYCTLHGNMKGQLLVLPAP